MVNTDELPSLEELRESGLSNREIAFQVWALFGGQSGKRTSEILREQYEIEHSPGVINQWAYRHGWRSQLREFMGEVAPAEMEKAALNLVGGVAEAAFVLAEMVRGNVEPDRDRINASTALLDRVGFLPHTRREAASTGVNQVTNSGELPELSMSDEELAQALKSIGRIRATVE